MESHSCEAATLRARLNGLPTLIEVAIERGDKEADERLRAEKGTSENIVPVLEADHRARYCKELVLQIANCKQNLTAAEAALGLASDLASQISSLAEEEAEDQGSSCVEASRLEQNRASVQMYGARHTVEEQRLKLAELRGLLQKNCPESDANL